MPVENLRSQSRACDSSVFNLLVLNHSSKTCKILNLKLSYLIYNDIKLIHYKPDIHECRVSKKKSDTESA